MMTQWFDKYTRPHWIGVYETRVCNDDEWPVFNYWNGLFWERTQDTCNITDETKFYAAGQQHIEWRGFTKEQK